MEINFILPTPDLLFFKDIGEISTFNGYYSKGNLYACVSACVFLTMVTL